MLTSNTIFTCWHKSFNMLNLVFRKYDTQIPSSFSKEKVWSISKTMGPVITCRAIHKDTVNLCLCLGYLIYYKTFHSINRFGKHYTIFVKLSSYTDKTILLRKHWARLQQMSPVSTLKLVQLLKL